MYLPRKILKDKKLNHGSKLLMYEVLSLNEMKLGCIAENYYFADLLNVKSTRTIQRYLEELKVNKYISIKMKTRPNRRGQTRLIIPTGNLLQSSKKIEHDLDIEMQKDNDETKEDWFTTYMKNNFDVKIPN